MTRWTFVVFWNLKTHLSVEFNWDMYIEEGSYGEVAMHMLPSLTQKNFTEKVKEFNERTHNYEGEQFVWSYDTNANYKRIKDDGSIAETSYLDMTEEYFDKYFSDYLFIKNDSSLELWFETINDEDKDKPITIKMEPGDSMILNFWKLYFYIEKDNA